MQRGSRSEEDGAILVLALVFMVVIALMLMALVDFSGNDLVNTSNLLSQQALEYGAEGGANVAIQTVRYSDDTYASLGPCFSTNNAIKTGANAPGVYVSCQSVPANQLPANTGVSREINFYACLSNSGCSATSYVVWATVDFVDGPTCSPTSIVSCGQTESVKTWLVRNANT